MFARLLARLKPRQECDSTLKTFISKSNLNPIGNTNMSTLTTKQVLLRDVSVSACKLRSSYQGRFGKQFGAVLSGEGLTDLGLKPSSDGGFWYSTNASYNGVDAVVAEDFMSDMDGNPINEDLSDGSTAHMLFNVTDYGPGIRKDGTPYGAGKNVKLVAVRATTFNVKKSAQDALSAMLLENSMANTPVAADADSPF